MSPLGSLKNMLSGRNRPRSSDPHPDVPSRSGCARSVGLLGDKAASGAENAPPPPPPPPYTPVDPARAFPTLAVGKPTLPREPSPVPSFSSARSRLSITSREDPYAFLSSFDTIFLIDDSASMAGRSWREVKEVLASIAPVCTSHDPNGIDVYFLNARNPAAPDGDDRAQGFRNITTPGQVEALFRRTTPRGATPTGARIHAILRPYLRRLEDAVARTGRPDDCGVRPVNMIVITDGAPSDDPEAVIVSLARRLDALDALPHQVGIQFFQVGSDPEAARALEELDDGLAHQGGVRDMVDTVTWESLPGRPLSADAILKVVLGAVVRRLDRKSVVDGRARRGGRLAP
ncbi:hypothetical protein VTH06DRAFT_5109 [Thermothelomyces fergusii]